jgi:hypothetical protein
MDMNFDHLKKTAIGVSLIALGCIAFSTAASAMCTGNSNPDLVQNGGFESGTGATIPNWTVFYTTDPHFSISNEAHKGGAQSLDMGSVGGENRISQSIATTAGSIYTVCFYLAPGGGEGDADFRAQWNNQDMVALKNIGNGTGAGELKFTYYQFSIVATGNDVLSFEARNDPSAYFLDNVAVQLCSSCSISNVASQEKKKQTFGAFVH